MAKKYFPKSFALLYFYSLCPILAVHTVVFARYPFFEPWCAPQKDPFLTKKGENVIFGPQGVFLCQRMVWFESHSLPNAFSSVHSRLRSVLTRKYRI